MLDLVYFVIARDKYTSITKQLQSLEYVRAYSTEAYVNSVSFNARSIWMAAMGSRRGLGRTELIADTLGERTARDPGALPRRHEPIFLLSAFGIILLSYERGQRGMGTERGVVMAAYQALEKPSLTRDKANEYGTYLRVAACLRICS